ncbi:MAG TPA: Gfo/Idh/MocA family oxidoreductase [Solirubrobacteraceae bacterium]|nr:Gfo/Idh/MocA family oxidoreductase [Solirubrobacteraceae bacterium]
MHWGILSTAGINEKFLAGIAGSSICDVLAVASRERTRADAYASEHGIARAYGSYEELLADPEIEAVYVPLPNALHLEWTTRALEAGKHVLCEKPLSRRTADVEAAFDLAEAEGRLLMEGFMYRHHPQTVRLAELVGAGAIGRLRLVRGSFSFPLADPDDVRMSRELDGGALMDVGCYCVNAARMLAGEAEQAGALATIGGDGVDIVFQGSMRCAHGVLAHFDVGFVLSARHDLEVVGEDAALYVRDPWHCRSPGIELRRGRTVESIDIPPANPYTLQADNFAAAIRGEAPPLLGRSDAVGQARTIEALYAAADAGLLIGI